MFPCSCGVSGVWSVYNQVCLFHFIPKSLFFKILITLHVIHVGRRFKGRDSEELAGSTLATTENSRFIHSGHFYSASSSPLLLRRAPDTARILCRSFTPKRHRQLRVKDLPMSLCGG